MLKRREDEIECYEMHKKITKELFGCTEDYIMTKIFDTKNTPYVYCLNEFPYKTKYKHKVFFINPRYDSFYDDERVKAIIGKYHKIWINESSRQSVHTIRHYQVYASFA
ncbi:hypothetical protein [Dishui Lake phycodnavirus 4]|nr:hypothetical protein [Dishui Lake phycodnavirus 4]